MFWYFANANTKMVQLNSTNPINVLFPSNINII